MKTPYENFIIQSESRLSPTWENRFIQTEISCQSESVFLQRVHAVVGVSLIFIHSNLKSFRQFYIWFSRKLAMNHRQWRRVRDGLPL